MSQLFDDLTALDRKLADRWKIRTRDNVRHILTPADIDFILGDLIRSARTTDITANQGSAIIMMYNASVAANSEKSGAAFDRIVHYVNIWEKAFRLNMQSIVDEEQLQQIADLLGNGVVSRITFKSPGTNISYAPFDYIAVGQLIVNRDVKVFVSHTGGLSTFADDAAAYHSNLNYLMIYKMDPRKRRLNIVHEATHTIQDWEDVTSLAHPIEADAFIAEAVAELTLYPDSRDPDDGDVEKTALAAAKMVIDKTAIDSNKAWQTAYKNVVTAVGQRYKKYGMRYIAVEKGEGASERTKFNELLQQITMINEIGGIALSLGDLGKRALKSIPVLKSIPLATGSH
jgi:hypothetical protein